MKVLKICRTKITETGVIIMKKILVGFLLFSIVLSAANPINKKTCSINGIKLAGKVKVVKNFADFKIT